MVEAAPQRVIDGRTRADADKIAAKLAAEGAKVEIR